MNRVGYAVLPFSLLVAAPSASAGEPAEPDPVVARVAGYPVRHSDVQRHVESLTPGDQIDVRARLDRFVESVVQEEVLFRYGLSRLDAEEPAFRDAVKRALVEVLIEREVKSRVRITEAEIERYYHDYQSQVRGEHWRVWHVPLESRARCDALLPRIDSQADLERVAREHGVIPELAARNGDMGWFMRHHDVLGLGPVLFKLPLRRPFAFDNQDGCHIIWISEHLDPPRPPLEAVRDRIRSTIARGREGRLLRELVDRAAKEIDVERYPLTR